MRPKTLTHIAELADAGLVPAGEIAALEAVAARYAVALSPAMRARIGAPGDAVGRQFIPLEAELETRPEERSDPIGDHAHSPVRGLVHRYPDRVLIKLTHVCPVYCRFCFRREMVGPAGDGMLSEAELDAAFAYVAAHPEIAEVIVTGGDPLMLSARRISALGARLAAIPHVEFVRWHSRVPVVAPEKVTPALAAAIAFAGKANIIAVHANAAQEFSAEAASGLARLAAQGIQLIGQTVLLKGVNDSPEALAALFRTMVRHAIRPAYLHHPDLAPGTGHFRLSLDEGRAIYAGLRGRLSGHAIPAYVLDIPGGHGKVPVGPEHVVETANGTAIRDSAGRLHSYPGCRF